MFPVNPVCQMISHQPLINPFLLCALQFHLLTMHTWQHFVLGFTWILRHQIVDPVVLSRAEAVGAQQLSARTGGQLVHL